MNYGDYYLDLSAIKDLSQSEQDNTHYYYREMLHCELDNRKSMAQSFFNTLQKAGYIKNATQESREEKIGELING